MLKFLAEVHVLHRTSTTELVYFKYYCIYPRRGEQAPLGNNVCEASKVRVMTLHQYRGCCLTVLSQCVLMKVGCESYCHFQLDVKVNAVLGPLTLAALVFRWLVVTH